MKALPLNTVNYEKIRAWLNDPEAEELTAEQRHIYARWDYAYDQLKLENTAAVARRLMMKFKISRATAYNDIQYCNLLLNPINRRDAEWLHNFIVEDAILQIKAAREKIDMKAWQKARADLIKIYAINKANQSEFNPAQLGNNNYYIAINFGNEIEKINTNELDQLPENKKTDLINLLYKDIDISDAESIMNS